MKKRTVFYIVLILFLASHSNIRAEVSKTYNKGLNVTPIPMEVVETSQSFTLSEKVVFVTNDSSTEKLISYFAVKIKNSTGYDLKTKKEKPATNYIYLSLVGDIPVNDEGYLLEVNDAGVSIQAKTTQGLFYGLQTMMQLLPAEIESPVLVKNITWLIPGVKIKDEPRFKYRGQHLDVCRHFVEVDFIKKQLDVLAMFKINKFHWHLTEDQAWRIEIKKYPKLTEIGSKRIEGDGSTYGTFFYTQEQIKEIVAYAKDRFIEVIPEIELPGHGVAALAAYPEYSCRGVPLEVRNVWAVSTDVYCAGNEGTFKFLTDIIEELIPLFESDYFHIGGDECPKDRWRECTKCQARIVELGLTADKEHSAEEKLQSYFVQRIEKVLLKNNKKMIGWDEILEGGLAPSATIMSWRGESGGIKAGNMGHDIIMTPADWLYLNFYQGDSKILPVAIGGYTTLDSVYNYEPVPVQLAKDKTHHVLGLQGNVWAEYLYEPQMVEYATYPRIIALAEVGWSAKERKNRNDFLSRMDNQRVRLDMHDINYYIPLPEQTTPSCNFVVFTQATTIAFKTTEPVKMVYTTDGREPDLQSEVYTKPLTFTESTNLKIRSVLASGKMGNIRTITIEKQSFAPAIIKEKDAVAGLKAEYYKGLARKASEISNVADETEYINVPEEAKHHVQGYREIREDDLYNTILTGYITIPQDGVYYFSTEAEEFWLGGKLFISNSGEVKKSSRNDKSVALAKGTHSIKLVRLSDTVGGFPALWEDITLLIRNDNDSQFKQMDASYFK